MPQRSLQVSITLLCIFLHACTCTVVVVPVEIWNTSLTPTGFEAPVPFGRQSQALTSWGIQDALAYIPNLSPDLQIKPIYYNNKASSVSAINSLIDFALEGYTLTAGNMLSDVIANTGQVAKVYDVAQIAGSGASSIVLANQYLYPYLTRLRYDNEGEMRALSSALLALEQINGRGWDQLAILSETLEYGVSSAELLIAMLDDSPIEVITYRQFIVGFDPQPELEEIKNSGARVIVVLSIRGLTDVFSKADAVGLLTNQYAVFTGSPGSSGSIPVSHPNGTLILPLGEQLRGVLGTSESLAREGPFYERMLDHWQSASPALIPGAGPGKVPPIFQIHFYDMGIVLVLAASEADKRGLFADGGQPTGPQWNEIIRSLDFTGATGRVYFDANGGRPLPLDLLNFVPELAQWRTVGRWDPDGSFAFDQNQPIIWRDNTTDMPDLDIRPAFDYWSCAAKEKRRDPSGKTINRKTPDGSSFDDIDENYHCDNFIDCHNMSDESTDCTSNYVVVFIVFGVVTGLMVLLTCCLLPFIVIFGFLLPRRRVRASSPLFLLIIAASGIVGFISTYAWYGKPHPVACGFQPWLLGLSVISLVAALASKTYRMWRVFREKFTHEVISNGKLFALYIMMMIPALVILILWTIVSTPTAKMRERDGDDHYVCATGGFTEEPGGLIFFFILVAYGGLVLLFGAFLTVVTRNVPAFFNETKLLAISIYNLGFLAVVVIPVFLVLQEFNPFAAWIIRTCAILYAFAATMVLQFLPMVFGVFIIDKGGDAPMPDLTHNSSGTKTSSQDSGSTPM